MNRRSFLTGLIAAPVVITTPGLLMPLRGLVLAVDGRTALETYFDRYRNAALYIEFSNETWSLGLDGRVTHTYTHERHKII